MEQHRQLVEREHPEHGREEAKSTPHSKVIGTYGCQLKKALPLMIIG
jgi:hypothetical protein